MTMVRSGATDRRRRWRRIAIAAAAGLLAATALGAVAAAVWHARTPLLSVAHAPERYARRAGDFAVSVTGTLDERARGLAFRVNDGDWRELRLGPPRAASPDFTVEIPPGELREGTNRLDLRASAPLRGPDERSLDFVYDPAPPELPLTVDWAAPGTEGLDVQDGRWEVAPGPDGAGWVRTVAGAEGWDRIVVAAGAFPDGRRVRAKVIVPERPRTGGRSWGVGVFALWGGQPDAADARPRRGWRFGLSWYLSKMEAVGVGFSENDGEGDPAFVETYSPFDLVPGAVSEILVEVWPERGPDGALLGWRQRHKWWREGEVEPATWIYADDRWGAALPDGEYGVALFALRAAASFGPVTVERFDGPEATDG